MKATAKKKTKFKISMNVGVREFTGILLCFLILFAAPIGIITYVQDFSAANTETYTSAAITEVQGQGRVAGVSTSKYVHIPILNFNFDTTLTEAPSIYVLFGGILLIGGVILLITIIASSNKKLMIKR